MHLCFLTRLPLQHSALSTLTWSGWCFGDGDALGCCCCEELGVCPVLSPLGSLGSLLFVHLRAKDSQKICGFSAPSCCSVALPLTETCVWLCLFYSSLHSASEDASVFNANLSCHQALGDLLTSCHCCFYKSLLFLQTEPVFRYLSAARIPFVSCLFGFFLLWCWDKWASHSQQLIECDYWGARRHIYTFMLAGPEQSSLFYSLFLLLTFLLHSFLFLFLFWLMAKSQRMK